jgi:hypothetical protein
MATINFWGNNGGYGQSPSGINHAAGSGLGFYGNGYGLSVPVGRWQDTTFITNANGTAASNQVLALNNTKFTHANSGETSDAGNLALSGVPNHQTPLNIRFTHGEAVAVQNCKLLIFDRQDITKNASGVTTKIYETRKPAATIGAPCLTRGGGFVHEWETYVGIAGQPEDFVLTNSPGVSGTNALVGETDQAGKGWVTAEGASHRSLRHDWYVAISASPDAIGSKTDYGLYFTCEYL